MSSDVVLTAALRNNLLSLQSTQNLIDRTQIRLATGRSVNSALDDPQSFFAADALNNRANDLSRLLDGLGQSINTIKAADQGIQSLTKLIEQADSLATTALEATSSAGAGASIVGDVDISDLTIVAATQGTLNFNFTDSSGNDLANVTGGAVAFTTGQTASDIVNAINAIRDSDGEQIVSAALTDSGRLQISTFAGINARIDLQENGDASLAEAQTIAGQLGLSSILRVESAITPAGTASNRLAVNLEAAASISSQKLYQTGGTDLALRSTLLTDLLRDADGSGGAATDAAFAIATAATTGDTYSINLGINGGSATAIAVTTTSTVQSLIDDINANVNLNSRISASFDEATGQITFAPLTGDVESLEFSVTATDNAGADARIQANFGFGSVGNLDSTTDDAAATNATGESSDVESIRFGTGGGDIAQAQRDFNVVRDQIDALVRDAGYRGVNLLNGDNLVTTFNEDRSNQLTTTGATFTSAGLGIDSAAFATGSAITTALTQVRAALTTVRSFGGSISNDLAIIQTREDFTRNTITNLQEGRDKLIVADQNEEGANLLALQTRQQLGVTSLSLASQSQQSVLRLF